MPGRRFEDVPFVSALDGWSTEPKLRSHLGQKRAMDLSFALLGFFVLISIVIQPCLWYLLVISVAAARARRMQGDEDTRPPRLRFLIAIPADDEEAGIAATLQSCRALNYPPELFEVLVVADNCTDQTAEVARREGATVLERTHATDRSKGHALKSMFDHLSQTAQMDSLDAVVILDADSVADARLLRELSRYLDQGHDWVQVFDTVANADDSWRTRLLAYAFGLYNGVLLLGQFSLGLSMAFGATECAFPRGDCVASPGAQSVSPKTSSIPGPCGLPARKLRSPRR